MLPQRRNALRFVGPYSCGRHGSIHQVSRCVKMAHRNRRVVGREITDPLVVDLIGPALVNQTIDAALNQEIAEMKGVEDAGVVECDRRFKGHSRA